MPAISHDEASERRPDSGGDNLRRAGMAIVALLAEGDQE
jgi:hypothetical protein